MEKMRVASNAEVKSIQLSILKSVDRFCQENDIAYNLMYGSLLGAIRHKGFIPWDDDIDICMLRKDYDRFIDSFYDERIVVKDQSKDPSFPFFYAKVSQIETHAYEPIDEQNYDVGISIDLFPLDNYPDDKKKKNDLQKKINRLRFKLISHTIDKSVNRRVDKKIAIWLLSQVYKKPSYIYISQLRKLVSEYCTSESKCVTEVMTPYGNRTVLEKSLFEESIRVPFENIEVSVPKAYHIILSSIYGDYMKLPPLEQQKSTHSCKSYLEIQGA